MPKVIKGGVREIVLKVKEFFLKEKQCKGPIIPFDKVNERVATATGVSIRTIARIVSEGKLAEASSSKIVTPNKTRRTRKDKILMDNFDIGVLRRKIHEFYSVRKEVPTVKKLHAILKEEIGFKGSREILRQHIKKIGFRYRKTKSNRKVLIERNDITAWRTRYLQSIKHNEETEKLPVVYIHIGYTVGQWQNDENSDGVSGQTQSKGQRFIIVHAGGEKGFVENASLIYKPHSKSGDDGANFKKWVIEKLVPNIKRPSLIIMDNASYNASYLNTSINRPPSINSGKNDIKQWLERNNIVYSEEYTKPQLLEIVNRNKPERVYAVDDILKVLGHKILRVPTYHCDLNPIEMVWASIKLKVGEDNLDQIPEMMENPFNYTSVDEWCNYCSHVKQIEEEYRKNDIYLDEPFIVQISSDTEESSDDEDDYMEDDEGY